MKIKKMKTRAMALGLALLMGMSTLGSAVTYAAETSEASETADEPIAVELADTEPAATEEKATVVAEDITKDVSDDTFLVESCMEGITYDISQEEVTLAEIKAEDGSAYQPNQAGTYIAKYMVIPKDKRDPYFVTRKVILTDTEGQAHAEDNGGVKQKEDTQSEEDSEEDSDSQPEVQVISTDEKDTGETLQQLEEDIASGNVLVFSGADNRLSARAGVTLEKGETIYYPSYIGDYLTCWFRVNGKIAYCLESHKASPPTGDYVAQVLDSNKALQKVLYYGYGGAGDVTDSYLSGKSAEEKYVYTHIAASYSYAGEAAFTGCDYNDLFNAGVIAYIDYLTGMEEPPKGELSLSKTDVKAVRSGNVQKTPEIKLNGDYRNHISITIPKDVTGYNKSKGTSATNGKLQVYGGDTFYLEAKMTVTGNYASGNLKGSVGETWRTLVLTTGEANQDIGVFESESAQPVSFKVDWLELARIELEKKDAETQHVLAGAIYGIYRDSACQNLLMQMPATDANGKAVSDYFDAGLKTVYVKEITARPLYTIDKTVYPVRVSAGKTVQIDVVDTPVKGKVTVRKADIETQTFLPQGNAKLQGAVYGLYAKEDIQKPDGSGVLYKKGSLIHQKTIGESGEIVFEDICLGAMFVKEISAPEGYLLSAEEMDATLTYEGQEKAVVAKTVTVYEQVQKQAFQIIKVSEDGSQTETDLVKGAEFTVYLISELSKVKNGSLKPSNGSSYIAEDFTAYDFTGEKPAVTYENGKAVNVPVLVTDAKGYAKSVELPYGSYICVETKTPANLKQVNPFLVTVDQDSREPQQWRIFDDRPFDFLLKIIKKDAQTNQPVLNNSATYKIFDCEKEEYIEQIINYPEKKKISEFSTNSEGYLVLPQALKAGHFRIEEISAPDSYVRQGYEQSLTDGEVAISPLDITDKGVYQKKPKEGIELVINADTPHQIDPDTGAFLVEATQYNDEQVGSLTLKKVGEKLTEVKGESILEKVAGFFSDLKDEVTGAETDSTGIRQEFVYKEAGVEGAVFELYAKDTIYSPDGSVDENGDPIIRYQKDDLVATLTTDADGSSVVNNLPLGSFYLKETKAGDSFVLNTEQKEFTLSAGNDTAAVVYETVDYKNERQKVELSIQKKDRVSGEPLEGVVFKLYAGEDILSAQGEVLVPKDTLIETKATAEDGAVTFDSQLCHGKYYVKEQHVPGYLPNEEIWEFEAVYENQDDSIISLTKEVENQPTETHFTKTDLTTGEEVEGATLQILDSEKNIVEEWTSTKETHVVYGLPAGDYILHEELAPIADGYVSAADVEFTVLEDGSIPEVEMRDEYSKMEISKTDLTTGKELEGAKLQVLDKDSNILEEWVTDGKPHKIEKLPVGVELTLREITAPEGYVTAEDVKFTLEDTREMQKVEMKDECSKVEISKTDLTTGKELEGAKLQVLDKDGKILEEWVTDGKPHKIEKLPVGVELTLREITAPNGYEIAEDVKFTLEDTAKVQKVEMKDKKKPETPAASVPKTGENPWKPIALVIICALSAAALAVIRIRKRKHQEDVIQADEKKEK
ncbi:SpaA isopeptide-forming pilin-related protein [Blautia producta]|uniref:SpaA isopeptide-forming pilin-related protein n=1 Tax=Blautia producta TaxID=33035 RepID=UPI0031B579AF